MSRATLVYAREFDSIFFKLPPRVRTAIEEKIEQLGARLADFPHQRLKGRAEFRLRVGDYRVIYEFDREVIGEPTRDVELVAAYYIPAMTGVNSFIALANRGVRLSVLTNSLSAADGPWAFSGYAKRRKALLEAGVTLYEMRRLSPERKSQVAGPLGSSGSSLHAKTFSADGERFFVGSFNFDPRSRKLNTELGFVIDSPMLAQKISGAFATTIPSNSYRVQLSDHGRLYWTEQKGDALLRYETEPRTGFWLRAAVCVLSCLPIDWLL